MKRILAWLCGLLSALGITACDYINVKELKPGVSTSAEVRERFGPPHMEWRNEDARSPGSSAVSRRGSSAS